MSILNSLKSLFTPDNGPAGGQSYPTEDYQGYQITPTPQRTGSQFRVCGLIRKGAETRVHPCRCPEQRG
ncbi:MAG: HlyU family transcriptional regulator [Thiolinea sp.]